MSYAGRAVNSNGCVTNQRSAGLVCAVALCQSKALRSLAAVSWQRPNNGSRMNREVHVRFWESPEVKVLRATRHSAPSTFATAMEGLARIADAGGARRSAKAATCSSPGVHRSRRLWWAATRRAVAAAKPFLPVARHWAPPRLLRQRRDKHH